MSDTSFVESDTVSAGPKLRAMADTEGMSYPEKASFWLESLAKWLHRGPRVDTWASARDDAADCAGIRPSMAARIWHRSKDMKFVDGETLVNLMMKYEEFCEKPEAAAAKYRAERLRLRGKHAAAHEGRSVNGLRARHARDRSSKVQGIHGN
ncbi:hypothetical protein MPL3356_60597 [Mesorhizobium plurifarium]|uniref:Uncharacterized protein n=1 Tax=Mesorhizobium plurifarium TaxID=69974 RepID=A0A090EFX5_MESPL|nr:hypothetical protein MPL3356_60597 [Mesorhizobium plurifarium]